MSDGKAKLIELRRHAEQDGSGNLNDAGKKMAADVGDTLAAPYAVTSSSAAPRAVQTASIWGASAPAQEDRLSLVKIPDAAAQEAKTLAEKKSLTMLEAYFAIPACRHALREQGNKVVTWVKDVAASLPEGGRALGVSHGGTIEPAALMALQQEFSLSVLGGELAPCEGVTFVVVGNEIKEVRVHRWAEL